MEQENGFNFVYLLKQVLMSKMWQDPNVSCDFTEYLYNNLLNQFHGLLKFFNYNDFEKSFTVKIMDTNIPNELILASSEDAIWRLCCAYKTSIENYMYTYGKEQAKHWFNVVMDTEQRKTLSNVITINAFPIEEDDVRGKVYIIKLY